jgi:hypothetical protein
VREEIGSTVPRGDYGDEVHGEQFEQFHGTIIALLSIRGMIAGKNFGSTYDFFKHRGWGVEVG